MTQIGLNKAAKENEQIVNSIAHANEGKIQYSDFIMATINLKTQLSEQMLYDTFKHFDSENKGYIGKKNLK